jgi:hypothetical protein
MDAFFSEKMLKEKPSSAEIMDGPRKQAGEVNINR